jgi:hypothetical protein
MVDRHARDIAGDALQDLLRGSISNDEYERKYPIAKDDPALRAIFVQVWFYYSDMHEHKLTSRYVPSDASRAFLERCVLFLKSNLEFQWPKSEFRLRYGIMRLLGLGRIVERRIKQKYSVGDEEVWPFLKKTEYEETAKTTLSGPG